jgi:glutamine synthetase
VGAELEFCLYDAKTNQPVDNSLFANSTTLNEQEEFISDLYDQLRRQHIRIELIHAEAGPGQIELVLAYQNDAMALVDNIVLTRETIVAVSHKYGFKALFLPKYDMTKAGNGLHLHLSLYQKSTKRPVFSEPTSISLLTKEAESFLEGILLRTCALTALTLPSSNSFLRVGKGCWTGSSVGWAVEDKESGIRLCSDLSSKKITNMEFKYCDAKANLYLALAGILRAGMDGLERKLKLRPSLDDNNGHHGEPLPENFPDALEQLKQDEVLLSMMGSKLGKAYLAVRSSEAERSKDIPLEEEVIQWLGRA